MTREEFEDNLKNEYMLSKEKIASISDEDYKKIEYVYTWHPSISNLDGKSQIAWIYVNFGMCVINDMFETASLNEDLEHDLESAMREVEKIKKRLEKLKKGEYRYDDDED